jgi:hypothetical protein
VAFRQSEKEDMLVACGRRCCLCHRFCGNKIECAHIEQGGPDELDNGIPLCLDCHAEVGAYNDQHPKGNKFSPRELKRHRDAWYQKMAQYPAEEMDEKYREADRRSFLALYRYMPTGLFLTDLDWLLGYGHEPDESHSRRRELACRLGEVHPLYFSADVASAVADFEAQLGEFYGAVQHIHARSRQSGQHYYRPYDADYDSWGKDQARLARRMAECETILRAACTGLRDAYTSMLDRVGRALPELVPLDPMPDDTYWPPEAEAGEGV